MRIQEETLIEQTAEAEFVPWWSRCLGFEPADRNAAGIENVATIKMSARELKT